MLHPKQRTFIYSSEMKITAQIVANQIPQEIRDLVIAVTSREDLDFDDPEIKSFLPPDNIIQAILASTGLDDSPSEAELDQANAWVKEQQEWITRSLKASDELNRREPLTLQNAQEGKFPDWFHKSWASKLNNQWSSALPEVVGKAEEYLAKPKDTAKKEII